MTSPISQSQPTETPDAAVDTAQPAADAGRTWGEKIDAAPGTWTWVPFADSACANGTPTGIGINPGTSKRLVLFLEAGGACWNTLTCYSLKTATHVEDGFGEPDFVQRMKHVKGGIFDRDEATNVFRDAIFVCVPYCTGDVHAGDREVDYDGTLTKHVGRRNLEAFLSRIVPTFRGVDRVILSGSSAGGFGAAFNYWRVKEAFGSETRIDLLDDSGPPFPSAESAYIKDWKAAWDLDGAVPPGCAECKEEFGAVLPYYFKTYPEARFALLSYTADDVIRQFFGMTPEKFTSALTNLRTSTFDPSANGRTFIIEGKNHVMLGNLSLASGSEGLASWLSGMQNDTTWSTVKP